MHYVTAMTPVQLCCSYRCAVTQHQCTAAQVLAKCRTHCSVLLCKTGSQHALCHCNYTCEDLLFIQVCSESEPMHCSTGFGKMHSALFSVALQNRLTACTMSLQLHLCSFDAHTKCAFSQHQCTAALVFAKMQSPLFSAALQNRVTACTISLQ
jgi:hypothetical protein